MPRGKMTQSYPRWCRPIAMQQIDAVRAENWMRCVLRTGSFVTSLKTAMELGITIPPAVLARATEVIE
jgi:hypothetical protein